MFYLDAKKISTYRWPQCHATSKGAHDVAHPTSEYTKVYLRRDATLSYCLAPKKTSIH